MSEEANALVHPTPLPFRVLSAKIYKTGKKARQNIGQEVEGA
jgi:hypothetical protein